MDLRTALNIIQLIISILLIVLVLLQSKGSSIGSVFGGTDSSIYRTRRGLEKRLYQFTIGVGVVFVLISLVSSVWGSAPAPAVGP
ncbi:MAG TPA: preprotein translocase subunit SecG [Chloroflexia bacterium]|nr:preprotein translocase subunit SecG [Chloroflexia bacterium]